MTAIATSPAANDVELVIASRQGDRRGEQNIQHQRPAPRAQLHHPRNLRPPLIGPGLHQQKADQLPEHLADFRRGGEIPAQPKRVPS